LKEIKKRVLPELDEEFFSKLGKDLKSEEDVKNRLREQIKKDKEEAAESAVRQQIADALLKDMDFPLPERLIEKKLDQMIDNIAWHMQERGIDLERAGVDEARLREKMRDDAITQVRLEMILDRICEDAGIDIPADELRQYNEYVDANYEAMNVSRDQLASAVFESVIPKLRASHTMKFLIENASIQEVDPDELNREKSDNSNATSAVEGE
jgi:trigger factor